MYHPRSVPSKILYIHELPFQPRKSLCDILDVDKSWEELGGHMQYDVTTLILIGQAIYREKSPTWELLNKYSEKNGTIKSLFVMLAKMDHQRAMLILKPYVDQKYHYLLRNEGTLSTTAFTCSKKEDIPRPSLSQLSMLLTQNSSQIPSPSYQKSLSAAKRCSAKNNPIVNSNSANFNQEFSSVSLHSKMKVLNVSQNEVKNNPKMLNMYSKRNSHPKEESISDNCISEKIKNVKKQSFDEIKDEKNRKSSSLFPCAVNLPSQEDCLPDIMRIPYKDICKATGNFNKERVLGRGGFGTVYKGEWKGTSVAIKRLTPRQSSHDPSQQLISIKQSLNELNVLKCCRFDHILPLYAVSLDGENPCLIYQLMVNGSLEDRLLLKNKTPALTWSQRSHIAECTTKGLNYLHTTPGKPLVHGDIKSANILLDGNMDAKIGDFGLTREGPGCEDTHVKVSSVHGTECYLPPEYLRQRHLSPQVDIYSYGIVLLEIATGLRPFDPKRGEGKRLADYVAICSDSGHLDSLRDTKAGEENMIWFRELTQIGEKCSSEEKKKRPPMQEVLEQFEKIKEEMFTKDKIRRLSNDKGTSIKSFKITGMNLSPLELQLFYDYQKDGGQPSDIAGKFSNAAAVIIERGPSISESPNELKENPVSEKLNQISSLSVESTSDTTDCSKSENCSIDNNQPINQNPSEDKSIASNPAPLPLLTVLQLQVSEFDDASDGFSSFNDSCNSNISHSTS